MHLQIYILRNFKYLNRIHMHKKFTDLKFMPFHPFNRIYKYNFAFYVWHVLSIALFLSLVSWTDGYQFTFN